MHFLTRFLISALSLGVAASIHIDSPLTLVLAAFLLGIVNAVIRPILVILTLPITILSLGLFLFVINALLFLLVAAILPGFHVSGFGSALLGWLVMTLISWIASAAFTK